MALINCPECGKPNQSDRGTCTGCGMNILEWRREEQRKAKSLEWEREREREHERQIKLEKELKEKTEREEREKYGDTKPCLGSDSVERSRFTENWHYEGCPNRVSLYASSDWCDTCIEERQERLLHKWDGIYN